VALLASRLLGAHVLALLLAAVGLGFAEGQRLLLEPATSYLDVLPREAVTLAARAVSLDSGRIEGPLWAELPPGWTLLVPPGELRLAEGAERGVLFTVLVPAAAKAGEHWLRLAYRSERANESQALFVLNVMPMAKVEVELFESPGVAVAGERYMVSFLVRNTGNVGQDLMLVASDNLGTALAVVPESVRLEPGQVQKASVEVPVSPSLTSTQAQEVELVARAATLQTVVPASGATTPGFTSGPDMASARTTVELVPRQLDSLAAYQTYPLTVTLTGSLDGDRADLGWALGRSVVVVSGSGKVVEDDPGTLVMRLENSANLARRRYLARYQRPGFGVALGHQGFRLSPLLDEGNGVGLSVNAKRQLDDWGVAGQLTAYRRQERTGGGLGAAVSMPFGAEWSSQVLVDTRGTAVSSGLQYSFTGGEDGIPYSAGFELEFGVRLPSGAVTPGNALLVGGRVRWGRSDLSASYRGIDAGFDGKEADRRAFDLDAVLSVDELLSGVLAWPVEFQLDWRIASERPSGSEMAVEALSPRRKFHFAVGLAARPGGAGAGRAEVDLEYQRFGTVAAGAGADEDGHRLGLGLGLTLAGRAVVQQSLAWRREPMSAGEAEDSLIYEGAAGAPFAEGRLNARAALSYGLQGGRLDQLKLHAEWSGAVAEGWDVTVGSGLSAPGSEIWEISADASHDLGDDSVLRFDFAASTFRDRHPRLGAGISYSFPVRVPLWRRADFGEVRGRLVDSTGDAMAGAIVQLGGLTTVTGADGRFHFPAIHEGEHHVRLRAGSLPPGLVTDPVTPYPVLVVGRQETALVMTVRRAARVEGRIVLATGEQPGPSAGLVFIGPTEVDETGLLRGVVIELIGQSGTRLAVSDGEGNFSFGSLLPGPWELQVRHGELPEPYIVELDEEEVLLAEGEVRAVEVRVVPVARRIEFVDEGVVRGDH
jgi:hypothetical protein